MRQIVHADDGQPMDGLGETLPPFGVCGFANDGTFFLRIPYRERSFVGEAASGGSVAGFKITAPSGGRFSVSDRGQR